MRVAQFIDTFGEGGAETVVLNLCSALRERAVEPVLLHFGSDYLAAHAARRGIEHHVVPGWRRYKSIRTLPAFAWEFRRLLRRLEVDAVHSHLFGPITAAAPACLLAGVPHVGTLHDVYVAAERPARVRLLQAAALLGTRLVAVSRDMEVFYRRALFGRRALRTVYNGLDWPAAPPAADLRRELGLGAADVAVVCVGRLVALKNHRLLLEAYATAARGLPATLLIVGDGPLRGELERTVSRLGLTTRVRFLGRRDDVPAVLAASDVFALTSDTEGLSCSVLEAMGAGLPSLVTRVGGNPELVVDGVTGFLVSPGDTAGAADRLRRLIQDGELRRRLGRAARQRATAEFSIDRMVDSYLRLYAGAADDAPAPAARRN